MFVGAVPKPAVEQILATVPFDDWGDVFVGCSGSFRFDGAVASRFPDIRVHSNDVSLLSCGLGALATGKQFKLRFEGRLSFVEDRVAKGGFADRVAAVVVALEMAKYKGANPHAVAHFGHYTRQFDQFLAKAKEKLDLIVDGLRIEDFTAGDFRQQVARAIDSGGGVAVFPPTYKGGYERLYRFVDDNTAWDQPEYDIWNPADLESWVQELDDTGIRYCVIADKLFETMGPTTVYRSQTNKPVYCYVDRGGASIRRALHRSTPFRYSTVDPTGFTGREPVRLVPAESEHMNFLKDKYLARGIAHTSGMMNYLVYIGDDLAGGFIFRRDKFGDQSSVYMLSDFAISRERRLSKLIAMLATSRDVVRHFETKLLVRVDRVVTTAFTDRPVSMKYRGIFDLMGRKPGFLNYGSKVRDQTPDEIYRDWFRKYARADGARNENGQVKAPRPQAA